MSTLREVKEFQKRDRAKRKAGRQPARYYYGMSFGGRLNKAISIYLSGKDPLDAAHKALEILGCKLRRVPAAVARGEIGRAAK